MARPEGLPAHNHGQVTMAVHYLAESALGNLRACCLP
eukprot:CAMPEP_0117441658 /NCGR_PEP_ID=MMETSP0759-20121206/3747_1 /TAXON_ID=63605 /ORGANISM="Percolomonas cosmopolitus, Strain WS" /LENGTH=36 /DNA_ID= /DNA_START= /DNA_END= /DNA_ORIENTATION=